MALVRWEPAQELATLQDEMNRLFGAFFDTGQTGNPTRPQRWIPAMDLVETEDAFMLRADLPGLDAGDVEIEVEDRVLTLSGERKTEHDEKHQGYYRVERGFGSFQRSLTLPEGVDADQVSASFAKGVLEIRIPKPEQRRPRRVQIGVGGEAPATIEGEASAA